jgi:hypothetical protein
MLALLSVPDCEAQPPLQGFDADAEAGAVQAQYVSTRKRSSLTATKEMYWLWDAQIIAQPKQMYRKSQSNA